MFAQTMSAQTMFCLNCENVHRITEYIRWDPQQKAVIKFNGCNKCGEVKEWAAIASRHKMLTELKRSQL